jgi:hypothetical protein
MHLRVVVGLKHRFPFLEVFDLFLYSFDSSPYRVMSSIDFDNFSKASRVVTGILTKMEKMPTYTWNKAIAVNLRHRIEGITSACLLRMQSLDSHELQSDAITLQRTCE